MITYAAFIREFAPIMQVYGADHYPQVVLELMHAKTKDLDGIQCRELIRLVLETCRFAPKVPDVIECANIVRARHREGIRSAETTDDGPRTPEVAKANLAILKNLLDKTGTK